MAPSRKMRRPGPTPKISTVGEGAGEDSFFALSSGDEDNNTVTTPRTRTTTTAQPPSTTKKWIAYCSLCNTMFSTLHFFFGLQLKMFFEFRVIHHPSHTVHPPPPPHSQGTFSPPHPATDSSLKTTFTIITLCVFFLSNVRAQLSFILSLTPFLSILLTPPPQHDWTDGWSNTVTPTTLSLCEYTPS